MSEYKYSRSIQFNFFISDCEKAKQIKKLDCLIRCEKCNRVFFCSDFILDSITCHLCNKKIYIDYSVISQEFKD